MSDPADAPSLAKANNYLAVELMKLLGEEETNAFFSPFSLSTGMAMLYLGTVGQTSEEMRHVLGYHVANLEDSDLTSWYGKYLEDLEKKRTDYVLSCANSVLSDKNFEVRDTFKSTVAKTFKALMLDVDFGSQTKEVLKQINDWVSEKTQKMIPELLDTLSPATVMVLLNAVYFKGNWLLQFDKKLTTKQKFYNKGDEKNKKKVAMMELKENFLYMEGESFKALELPYKGEEVAMMILLPHALDGVRDLEIKLSVSFIQDTKKDMRARKVAVSLPKFRLEYKVSLKDHFQKMGLKKIFAPGGEFYGMTDDRDIYVSKIVHKAVLDVNEEGSEASAATAIVMARSLPRVYSFVADHPFLLVIYDTRTSLIYFIGKVQEL